MYEICTKVNLLFIELFISMNTNDADAEQTTNCNIRKQRAGDGKTYHCQALLAEMVSRHGRPRQVRIQRINVIDSYVNYCLDITVHIVPSSATVFPLSILASFNVLMRIVPPRGKTGVSTTISSFAKVQRDFATKANTLSAHCMPRADGVHMQSTGNSQPRLLPSKDAGNKEHTRCFLWKVSYWQSLLSPWPICIPWYVFCYHATKIFST